MTRSMIKVFRLALLLFGLAPTAALAEPPVWVIKDADSTIILFGSVHILPQGLSWRPKALDAALSGADDVWFEIAVDPATKLAASQGAMMRALLPQGQSLLAMLEPATKARLERVAKAHNLPMAYLDKLRPWMADLVVSQAFVDKRGARLSEGVEQVISGALPAGVERRAFETPDQQLSMLAGAPEKEQLAMLAETLRSIEEKPESFDDIVALWLKSDVNGMAREAIGPLKETSPYLYDVLVKQRNTAWVRQITERLAGSGDTVMVVGVGHLVGPDSVPAMLRARGVKVSGP